jgi:aspartyl-tRNA(Asn)/glutamyl-tRNA(Gln) amidotransferase subunit B
VNTSGWEPVIGLEIHVQLKTRTKMFCRCEVGFGAEPNTQTCPVCLAHPGALPVPNRLAVEWTIRLGLALGCRVADRAVFHRKNYFYPDNPKGYQISQYDEPLCVAGAFALPRAEGDLRVGIVRAHLEEDAAKTIHVGGAGGRIVGAAHSDVDFNRGGTPLVEIVTEPDLRSSEDAKRFLQLLRQTVVELGVSDAEMEKGTLRFDVNVSVRPSGSDELRTRTELKNMNSFNFAARGIEREIRRQIGIYESGGQVEQETMHFDPSDEAAPPLRTKEGAEDYRYFPEPDLVPLEPERELVERVRAALRELPGARIERLEPSVGFDAATGLVTSGRDRLYERLAERGVDARVAANAVMNEIAAAGVDPDDVSSDLADVIREKESLPRDVYLRAVTASLETSFDASEFLGQRTIGDASELDPLIDRILQENESQVAAYRGGKEGLLGFFVGQVMKATDGKANPRLVNERLLEKLSGS